jgi:phosphatidylserine decarboxylase
MILNLLNLLYLVPKNWLSRVVGKIVERRWPFGFHTVIRDQMIRVFKPDVAEAEQALDRYPTWADFFTRRLRPGARPLGPSPLVCPVDGTLTQRGLLESPRLFLTQIKGLRYSLKDLLAGWDPAPYAGGAFLTVYLAPYNYHRIHAPAAGKVLRARHVPGALWPVNAWSVQKIAGLFVRNDRVLVEMEGPLPPGEGGGTTGRLTNALIGATNVGRTTLAFSDLRGNDPGARGVRDFTPKDPLPLAKGAELACFEMGSTIVLILDARWAARLRPELLADTASVPVRLGLDLAA